MAEDEVFICYSHVDQDWKRRVGVFMEAMKMAGEFSFGFWDDAVIDAGANWKAEITEALDRATVCVLLVSADFMASEYIQEREIPHMRKREEDGDLILVPLLLRPCPWTAIDWMADLQFVNVPEEPLSGCTEHRAEEILNDLVWRVRTILEQARTDFDSEVEKDITSEEASRVGDLLEDKGFESPSRDGAFTEDTFLTTAGVTHLLEASPRNSSHSTVVGLIRIFRTSKQRTWLVATQSDIFCILDDEKTAAGNRPIQWQMPLGAAVPILVRPRAQKTTGLVNIGLKKNWLYSQKVYPDPGMLQGAIEAMIDAGRRA